ncbi:MAG: hypothetical protein JXR36_02610 [Bacteroidales bacterium]|nr:hypothetical protein [Bacteroidales bacterium]
MKKQFLYLLILAAVIVSLTSSCTPQKRLNRLVALHPELATTDTIRIRDTTIIPETRIDTSFNQDRLKDTVILTKEKLTVKIHQVLDTVYVEADHAADTVVVEKEVVVERVVRDDGKQYHFLENNSIKTHVVIALVFVLLCISIVIINKQ